MDSAAAPAYLDPYLRATARHGAGFKSLLWASPQTQAARFHAFTRLYDLRGKSMADVGCGRADLLDYLLGRGIGPQHYVGIEAVQELAQAAEAKRHPRCLIVHADFVLDPKRLFVGADAILFSGSLNTLANSNFWATLTWAFEATAEVLMFNFLASPMLAGEDYLKWYRPETVRKFAATLSGKVQMLQDYLPGDCTVAMWKDR